MAVERVTCFIDGYNLYHSIVDLRRPDLKWVNLWALSEAFVSPQSQTLTDVYYFSALAYWWPDRVLRHREYIKALINEGVTPIMGNFKKKSRRCPSCDHKWVGHEEKETDVNIALALINEAHKGTFDHALLVSRDADLAPAVRLFRRTFPDLSVTIVAPPNRGHSTELIGMATGKKKIKVAHLERCLFPQEVYDAGGNKVAKRPTEYDPPAN